MDVEDVDPVRLELLQAVAERHLERALVVARVVDAAETFTIAVASVGSLMGSEVSEISLPYCRLHSLVNFVAITMKSRFFFFSIHSPSQVSDCSFW